jgi:hypothetical protein
MKKSSQKLCIVSLILLNAFNATSCSHRNQRAKIAVAFINELSSSPVEGSSPINRSLDTAPTCPLRKGLDLDQKTIGQVTYACTTACIGTAAFFVGYGCKILWHNAHQKTE